ncbi:macrolide family glycosyltransferase [Nonomuraea sp. B19D2]|uniref:macrolide family glycosyltransferase n=1 Tax=Nonomuraea sp. B19D2 TaxID=3159561 RepID=UPI0032DB9651
MGHHIAFVAMPVHGHVLPTLGVVEELARRGHRVSYLIADKYAEAVRGAGGHPIRYPSEMAASDLSAMLAKSDPMKGFELMVTETAAIVAAAREGLPGGPPDAVVYDQMASGPGRMLAGSWAVPAVQTIPTPVYARQFWAQNTSGGRPRTRQAAPSAFADTRAKMTEVLRAHGIDLAIEDYLRTPVEEHNLVFLPRSFHKGEADPRYVFVGPCLGTRSFLGEWQPPGNGLPVILISLGTVYNAHPGFFRGCIEAFADAPLHVVISLGEGVDPATLGPLPPNVEVHRWVPHLRVLEHARVLVTHGGLGSVMEAFHWGRPIVVAPVTPLVDIHQRVKELGLGYVLEPEEIRGDLLRAAVERLLGDEETTARAAAMRQALHDSGGGELAADQIEKVLAEAK